MSETDVVLLPMGNKRRIKPLRNLIHRQEHSPHTAMSASLPVVSTRKRLRADSGLDDSLASSKNSIMVGLQRVEPRHCNTAGLSGPPPKQPSISITPVVIRNPAYVPPTVETLFKTGPSEPTTGANINSNKPIGFPAAVKNPLRNGHNQKNGHPRFIAIKNQKYQGPRPIVVPVVPNPTLTTEQLIDLSKKRSARCNFIAERIIAETGGLPTVSTAGTASKPKAEIPPLPPYVLSMEALKTLSSQRAQQSREIAARIIAEDTIVKQAGVEDDRYACPAKKMGPAHNKNTAYFSIPPTSIHGMPLICSHALCRKGRLKFVYCKYCNQPVSRMKFDERHAHPEHLLLAFADVTKPEDEEEDEESDEVDDLQPLVDAVASDEDDPSPIMVHV